MADEESEQKEKIFAAKMRFYNFHKPGALALDKRLIKKGAKPIYGTPGIDFEQEFNRIWLPK